MRNRAYYLDQTIDLEITGYQKNDIQIAVRLSQSKLKARKKSIYYSIETINYYETKIYELYKIVAKKR